MLQPQWLRSFAVLVELNSFTRAAERLGVTQAAVSQHVRQLEAQLGPLLVRRPRQLELMPAGVALLDYCRDLDLAERRMQERLSDRDPCVGDIGIITPGSVGLSLYPRLLALQQAHPGLVVRHRFAPDTETVQAVLENRYDLGIVTLRQDNVRLVSEPFGQEALELVAPVGARADSWDDLTRLGFIDHPDGHAMATRLLSRYFPGNSGVASLPLRGFSNQIGLILEPVARGLGFTVLPAYARQAFARQEALQVIGAGPQVVDSLWLIHHAEWPLSARTAWVAAHLRAAIADNA